MITATEFVSDHQEARAQLRPSLLPWIDQSRGGCPRFVPDPVHNADIFELGSDRHRAFKDYFYGNISSWELLPEADRDGVRWAVDYVNLKAALLDHPIVFEHRINVVDDDFRVVFPEGGTLDAACGRDLFDLKWRPKGYRAQLAAYAIGWMDEQGFDWLRIHALYGAIQSVSSWTWTREQAWEVMRPVLADYQNGVPRPCSSCGSCASRLSCPAFNLPAVVVAEGREDWKMQTYHVSDIQSPEDMAKAIALSSHLRKWCDAVDFFKREWAIKQGIKIPGYCVRHQEGDRQISDVNAAFQLSGIPLEKFIGVCGVGIGDLKKLWASHYGVSEKVADKQINERLSSVIKRIPFDKVVKVKTSSASKEIEVESE